MNHFFLGHRGVWQLNHRRPHSSANIDRDSAWLTTAARKPQVKKKRDDFARLEDGHVAHGSRHFDGLGADEDALKTRIAFFKQHLDNFLKIHLKFVECLTLAVSASKTRNQPTYRPVSESRSITAVNCFMMRPRSLRTIPEGRRRLQRLPPHWRVVTS